MKTTHEIGNRCRQCGENHWPQDDAERARNEEDLHAALYVTCILIAAIVGALLGISK